MSSPNPIQQNTHTKPAKFIRLYRFLNALALFWGVLALVVIILGGVRFQVAGFMIKSTHLTNPLLFSGLFTLLAWLLRRDLPLSKTPLYRLIITGACAFKKLFHNGGKSRLLAILIILLCGVQTWQRAASFYHLSIARNYFSHGQHAESAAAYQAAQHPLDPNNSVYRQRAAYNYHRAGMFDACLQLLETDFVAGRLMEAVGYRALWRCLQEKQRYGLAIEVVEVAMGSFPRLDQEGSGVLTTLRRQELLHGSGDQQTVVKFSFAAPHQHTPLFLAGNWSKNGSYAEAAGWSPTPMTWENGYWSLQVSLSPSRIFPYNVMVLPSQKYLAKPALAMADFYIDPQITGTNNTPQPIPIKLTALAASLPPASTSPMDSSRFPRAASRQSGADGRTRVLTLWPDAGSWFLINSYVRRGLLPNIAHLLQNGTRGEMISTHPPFTATAYVRMVELGDAKGLQKKRSVIDMLMLQLKGIPFLDPFFPDSLVSGNGTKTIFTEMADHHLTAVNLVFGDKYIAVPNDLSTGKGKKLNIDKKALVDIHDTETIDTTKATSLLSTVLDVDAKKEPKRAKMILSAPVFLLGVENSEDKLAAGKKIWHTQDTDFLLLRFPSVDIISHQFFPSALTSPRQNIMLETYRHLDRLVGEFVKELDQDDTLIFVSDHGIQSSLSHHRTCVLIMEGPGLPPQTITETIPIAHFPSVVLSRFGIPTDNDRLTETMRQLLFPLSHSSTPSLPPSLPPQAASTIE